MFANEPSQMETYLQACQTQLAGMNFIHRSGITSTVWPSESDYLVFVNPVSPKLHMLATTIHVEHADTNVFFKVGCATTNYWFDQPGAYLVSCLPREVFSYTNLYAKPSKPCRIVSHYILPHDDLFVPVKLRYVKQLYTARDRYEFAPADAINLPSCSSNLASLEVECATMISCKLVMTPFGAKMKHSIVVGEQSASCSSKPKIRFDVGFAFGDHDDLTLQIVHNGQPANIVVFCTNLKCLT
jgi:hypothetical protein